MDAIRKRRRRIIVKRLVIFFLVLIVILFFALGVDNDLKITMYSIENEKIESKIRIALVADLHSSLFGEEQEKLIDAIDNQLPDLVFLAGDIVDDVKPIENAELFLEKIAQKYRCFYVSGNHEYWSGKISEIKDMIRGYGIEVLEGDCKNLIVNGQTVNVCGIDDIEVEETKWFEQLKQCSEKSERDNFSVLLSHRPERYEFYNQYSFDLVLCGHTHGGHWRVLGLINGLYAPSQGVFPKYAGGHYRFDEQNMIVSRGLSYDKVPIPRLYNPPELVIVDVVPRKTP